MYARTSTIQADPARIDEGIAYLRDQVIPAVTAIEGCVGMSLVVERDSGRCIATAAWATEDAMRDSAEKVRPYRDEAQRLLGAESSEVEVWEVAAVHRDHAMPEGACARLTFLSADPSTADRAVDVYKLAVLPKIQEFDGFCSASLLINREKGRAVGTLTFERHDQLEATRDAATRIREMASHEMGATVDEVVEVEVALAHLHLPELV